MVTIYDGPAIGAAIAAAVELTISRPARLGATRLIAIDGPSGSGKTTFAAPLAAALARAIGGDVIVPTRRSGVAEHCAPRPAAPAGGAVDSGIAQGPVSGNDMPPVAVVSTDLLATWEHPLDWWPLLEENLLAPIARGETAVLPVIEWVSGNPRPGGAVAVPPVEVLVLEGVSAGRRAIADRLTALVWVEVADAARRLERAVGRDGEAMRPFLVRWQGDEQRHFADEGTRSRADIVIDPAEF